MATRSDIIVHRADGTWKRIYCHWDGYLEHNGRILQEHYNSQELADLLVEPGDLSSLGPNYSKPQGHSYDTPVKGYCVYFGRDRGETDVEGYVGDSLDVALSEDYCNEYTYVWDNGQWWLLNPDSTKIDLISLHNALYS